MTPSTLVRPASQVLDGAFAAHPVEPGTDTAELDVLAVERARIMLGIAELVVQMDDEEKSTEQLDALTERIAVLLARAEQLRVERARIAARRAGDARRWIDYLDAD